MSALRRPSWIVLAVSGIAVVLLVFGGCGQSGAPGGPAGQSTLVSDPIEGPMVTLGGYTFGSTSNRLNHPFFKATPTTPDWVYSGIGTSNSNDLRTCVFSDGRLVAGVKTLRMSKRDTGPWNPTGWWEDFWYAQDTQGNLHVLKHQLTRDADGYGYPAELWGVAEGGPPVFWLPRASQLTLNRTWTFSVSGKVVYQCKITSLTGHVGGKTGLLVVRGIYDQNEDGTFNPSWTGPDRRDDNWYRPAVGPWYWQHRSNGGLLRQ